MTPFRQSLTVPSDHHLFTLFSPSGDLCRVDVLERRFVAVDDSRGLVRRTPEPPRPRGAAGMFRGGRRAPVPDVDASAASFFAFSSASPFVFVGPRLHR